MFNEEKIDRIKYAAKQPPNSFHPFYTILFHTNLSIHQCNYLLIVY